MASYSGYVAGTLAGFTLFGTGCVGALDDPAPYYAAADVSFGDSGAGDGGTDTGVACVDVVQSFFASSAAPQGCAQASCHPSTEPRFGTVDLESANLVSRLVDQPSTCSGYDYINSTDPTASYVYLKLGPTPPCGSQMPSRDNPLTTLERGCVLAYIQQELAALGGADAGTDAGSGAVDTGVDLGVDAGSADTGVVDAGSNLATIEFEAEDMTIVAPFSTVSDANASNGQFVSQTTGEANYADPGGTTWGSATYTFNLPTAGRLKIWGRVHAPSTDEDSVYVSLDGGTWVTWNDLSQIADVAFAWDDVHNSAGDPNVPAYFDAAAGSHTFELSAREIGLELDRFVITQDDGYVPN